MTPGLDQVRERIAATSAAEVARESLERARAIADLNAFLILAEQPEGGDGPLAGVPLAVKANLDTLEFPTSGGTAALRESRPRRD